jgi:hypothetical protein
MFLGEAPGLARMARHAEPLVKCIWSNMMLAWIVRRFQCRLVFLVRHPGAVIESEFRNDWKATRALDCFRADARFRTLTKGRYQGLLGRELSPIEELAVHWLIENQWAVDQAPSLGAEVVFYEHLQSGSASAWERVRQALGVHAIPGEAMLARPSQQSARRGSVPASADAARPAWLSGLTEAQKAQIQSILDLGRFELYSMADPDPRERIVSPVGGSSARVDR